jgi:hypothetical protein
MIATKKQHCAVRSFHLPRRACALPSPTGQAIQTPNKRSQIMGINSERDVEANMQIGPTDQGMVRIFIESQGVEIPMDFTPEEAEEIAAEILAAAKGAAAS